MKCKIIFPQNKCKSVIPNNAIVQMKNALKEIEYPDALIGPKTVKEVLEHNSDNTGYGHCIFNDLLTEKITTDYNTIKDGLELLDFYKSKNKYFTIFDREVKLLAEMSVEQNETKFVTSNIVIDTEDLTLSKMQELSLEKIWLVYLNGVLKSEDCSTLLFAIIFAKNCMFYGSYNKVVIKPKKD